MIVYPATDNAPIDNNSATRLPNSVLRFMHCISHIINTSTPIQDNTAYIILDIPMHLLTCSLRRYTISLLTILYTGLIFLTIIFILPYSPMNLNIYFIQLHTDPPIVTFSEKVLTFFVFAYKNYSFNPLNQVYVFNLKMSCEPRLLPWTVLIP